MRDFADLQRPGRTRGQDGRSAIAHAVAEIFPSDGGVQLRTAALSAASSIHELVA